MGKNKFTYSVSINGMKCGMCEAHVNDLFRKHLKLKKVKSSHLKKQTLLISLTPLSEQDIKDSLEGSGYKIINIEQVV